MYLTQFFRDHQKHGTWRKYSAEPDKHLCGRHSFFPTHTSPFLHFSITRLSINTTPITISPFRSLNFPPFSHHESTSFLLLTQHQHFSPFGLINPKSLNSIIPSVVLSSSTLISNLH